MVAAEENDALNVTALTRKCFEESMKKVPFGIMRVIIGCRVTV
jgi:hypothetical protein